MSVIGGLLEKIRGKRKAKFASKAAEYDSFVVALSRGDEVDVDTLATLLDELDKSDTDLEADIKAKQRRFEIVAQLADIERVEKQLQKNEAELAKLNSEIEQFLRERRQKTSTLDFSIREMRALVSARSSLTHDLQHGHGIPLHLATRRDELATRRKAWGAMQREYEDRTREPRTMVRQLTGHLEVIDGKIAKATDSAEAALLRGQRSQVEAEQKRYQSVIDGLADTKRELDSEQAAIEKEERALTDELMKP